MPLELAGTAGLIAIAIVFVAMAMLP